MSNKAIITKIHLIISVLVVLPTAINYGFFPNVFVDLFPKTIDELNFNKAVMGLYLGFSTLWLLGIFRKGYLQSALISNIIFMLGLGLGRVVSMIFDGLPTFAFLYGTFAELFLGVYGVWVLSTHQKHID